MYLLLLAVIYLAFISLGLPDSLLGAAWPVMHQELGVPVSGMGIVSMLISGGTIVSSLCSERCTRRFGTSAVTTVSVALTAAALFGFSTGRALWHICLWAIPYGLGAGAIDAALNGYVSMHYSSRHMSWLHCFWGVGTIISPYVMSAAITRTGWQQGYRNVSCIQMGILVVLILTLPLWKRVRQGEAAQEAHAVIGLRGALGIRGVPALLTGFFAYCGAEATAMLWISSYLAEVRHVPEQTAAAFGALFFIGITAGRFLAGLISDRMGDRNMIRMGCCIALCGVVLAALPLRTNALALAGFVVLGLGCAPVYPSIIHATPANFGEQNAQAIIGIQMASAYLGSTFMPPLFGLMGEHVSMRIMPFYIGVLLLLMFCFVETAFRKAGERT